MIKLILIKVGKDFLEIIGNIISEKFLEEISLHFGEQIDITLLRIPSLNFIKRLIFVSPHKTDVWSVLRNQENYL